MASTPSFTRFNSQTSSSLNHCFSGWKKHICCWHIVISVRYLEIQFIDSPIFHNLFLSFFREASTHQRASQENRSTGSPSWFQQTKGHSFSILLPCTFQKFYELYVVGAKVSERHSSADQRLVDRGEGEEAGGGAQQCGDQGGLGKVSFAL